MPKYWIVSNRDLLTEVNLESFDGNEFTWIGEYGGIYRKKLSDLKITFNDCSVRINENTYLYYISGIFERKEDALHHALDNIRKEIDLVTPHLDEDKMRAEYEKDLENLISSYRRQIERIEKDIVLASKDFVNDRIGEDRPHYIKRHSNLTSREKKLLEMLEDEL